MNPKQPTIKSWKSALHVTRLLKTGCLKRSGLRKNRKAQADHGNTSMIILKT